MDDLVEAVVRKGEVIIVRVVGEMNINSAPNFHTRVLEEFASAPQHVVIDLGGLTFMDSTGIGTLLEIMRRLTRAGGKLSLVRLTDFISNVFDVTKMNQVFSIYATEEEALAA